MRSYGQYCPLARGLDVVGERWTLLIVRELSIRDCRYSDLRDALPGLATNLLADRLRRMEADGVIERHSAPRPVGATVYRLTERGRRLMPAIQALAAWGAPLLNRGQDGDEFRSHWLVRTVDVYYAGVDVTGLAPLTLLLRTGDEPVTLQVTADGLRGSAGEPSSADLAEIVTVRGEPEQVMALLAGKPGHEAQVTGDPDAQRRLSELVGRAARREISVR